MLWVNMLHRSLVSHHSINDYQKTRYCIAMMVITYSTYVHLHVYRIYISYTLPLLGTWQIYILECQEVIY